MFVVLAYAHDRGARDLVARWRGSGRDAAVMTCADLSRAGWIHRPGDPDAGRAVVDGQVVATHAIRGVVVRMPAVAEAELAHLHAQDRPYAVAEMQAFLLAWLSALACPVLNRPTPASLAGPAWHPAEWVARARRLGLAARAIGWRSTSAAPPGPRPIASGPTFVDVLDARAFGLGGGAPQSPALAAAAVALARDAGVEMLRVYFEVEPDGGPTVVEVGHWIDLTAEAIADTLVRRLHGETAVAA
jgi:hypothetical protein